MTVLGVSNGRLHLTDMQVPGNASTCRLFEAFCIFFLFACLFGSHSRTHALECFLYSWSGKKGRLERKKDITVANTKKRGQINGTRHHLMERRRERGPPFAPSQRTEKKERKVVCLFWLLCAALSIGRVSAA